MGIETPGGVMRPFIERNSTIPTKQTRRFTIDFDNQTTFLLKVFEGECSMIEDIYLLGYFELTDIPPAPHEIGRIEITLDINANDILNVSAFDQSSGKEKKIIMVISIFR